MFRDDENSYWIREKDGTYELLVFNAWSDGSRDCCLFRAPAGYVEELVDEIRRGERELLTYALAEDWYSLGVNDTWDSSENEYVKLREEVDRGLWTAEEEWIAENVSG